MKKRLFISFLILFLFKSIFAGLLPEAVVEVDKNEYKLIKNLKNKDKVISIDEDSPERCLYQDRIKEITKKKSRNGVLLELEDSNGKKGMLLVGKGQMFYKAGVLDKHKFKLLNHVKPNKEKLLKLLLKKIWTKAEDLKIGDKVRSSQDNQLTVVNSEIIKFDNKLEFYELHLKKYNNFYIFDSAGHYVLTHNIGFLGSLGIGALIGAIVGGSYVAWSSHKKGVFSKKVVIKGAFCGAVSGIIAAAAIYGMVYLYSQYSLGLSNSVLRTTKVNDLYNFLNSLDVSLSNPKVLSKCSAQNLSKLIDAVNKVKVFIVKADVTSTVVPPVMFNSLDQLDKIIEDAYNFENGQMDFSTVDVLD